MKNVDIIRAWKDKSYRDSLTAEQLAQLPENPVGEISEAEQATITGGWGGERLTLMYRYTCGYPGCPEVY